MTKCGTEDNDERGESRVVDFLRTLYVITGVQAAEGAKAAGGENERDKRDAVTELLACFRWVYVVEPAPPHVDVFEHVLMTHAADPYLRRLVPFELEPLMETYLGGDVPPEVWGPRLWALLHALAHYEPRHVARVLCVLTSLIPCRACGDDLRRWLLSHPGPFAEDAAAPTTRNKSDAEEEEAARVAQAYVVALHNHVNKKLGKNVEMVFYSYL